MIETLVLIFGRGRKAGNLIWVYMDGRKGSFCTKRLARKHSWLVNWGDQLVVRRHWLFHLFLGIVIFAVT